MRRLSWVMPEAGCAAALSVAVGAAGRGGSASLSWPTDARLPLPRELNAWLPLGLAVFPPCALLGLPSS